MKSVRYSHYIRGNIRDLQSCINQFSEQDAGFDKKRYYASLTADGRLKLTVWPGDEWSHIDIGSAVQLPSGEEIKLDIYFDPKHHAKWGKSAYERLMNGLKDKYGFDIDYRGRRGEVSPDKEKSSVVALREILAAVYPDETSARRVVSDAGLDGRHISFTGQANNTWHAILQMAENTGKIDGLLDVVLREFGTNQELRNACESYRGQVQSKSKKSTERESQGTGSFHEAPITILFLAANPTDTTRLRLDEESRSIDQALRQAEFRDRFELEQAHAVRVADLQGLLLRYQPHIVHFSGHGSATSETTSSEVSRHVGTIPISGHGSDGGAIILEDNAGKSHPVMPRALSTVFSLLKDNIRCVVLNACYSAPQAQAIAEHIDCVVGMSDAIGDKAAISFATAFYQALGYGRDVKTAFELGRAQIDLENIPEEQTPQLLATKVDPAEVVLVSPA